jgi:hypothetical protein
VRRAPDPGPSRGDRGVLSILFIRPFAVASRDRGVRHPQLPSSGSQIAGSSLSCYRVVQMDARAPFDKGRLVVQRHVHESAYAGVLGRVGPVRWGMRARKLSLDGIPQLAALVGS